MKRKLIDYDVFKQIERKFLQTAEKELNEAADAIAKAIKKAQKSLVSIPIVNGTISTAMTLKFKGAIIMIRPGKKGSGLIAGGPVRAVVELAGIQDIVSKIIGSKNN